ncbi:GGDEF domain-containing protein [Marinimicrobium sp. ABcell2]|uniref:GGDEF domain-containing protein n=1 Tax=Marinimicrobium sp. ABcell2 TaxID=3069751 RepID=UPI0027B72258|nr:GGDEF domain-containing protein [Marinimicrobium sp. ABcell2]MDQ2075933.1 GGDEF domain-containing protein [Marinimicrobium sp. ABcell2]
MAEENQKHFLSRFGVEIALALFVVLTLVAIVAERPILQTGFTIDARHGEVSHYNDSVDGGLSTSEIIDSDAMEWRCVLAEQAIYSFCGFELILDQARTDGLDLRNYDRIRIWLDYEGPTESIRFYLRNHDPVYSTPELHDTTKYNQIEFDAEMASGGPFEFSMHDFFVANWWFQRYRIAPELAHPQFDNIVVLEVQTGSAPQPGLHTFRMERVEFTGQVLTSERWYQGIVGSWLIAALVFLGSRTVKLNRELRRRSQRERELLEINALLDHRGQQLEQKTKTDPLTGAFNRTGIEEALKVGLEERRRAGKPLSIVMLDIDQFKPINDTYGHAVGDRILTALSTLVQENIRGSDLFARWGGEEFALVCRNTSLRDAAAIAEKLRVKISLHHFDEDVGVTASFGVATLGERESLEQIFERADQALYRAKDLGRNRVVVSD